MKLLICVHHPFDQWNAPHWFSERLRREFSQIEIVQLPNYERVDEEVVDAEIVIAWSIRPEQIVEMRAHIEDIDFAQEQVRNFARHQRNLRLPRQADARQG